MKADLHIHTVLSPCGDMEMSPREIVRRAKARGLEVIAITDHNSTRQAPAIQRLGAKNGLTVLAGAEVNTREEVHVIVLVEGEENRLKLQAFLDEGLPAIPNNTDIFGYQLVVDEAEQIEYEEEKLLISAIDRSIEEVAQFVRSLGGIVIPAHIDKPVNSLFSQLGFVPPHLDVDALEISPRADREALLVQYPYLSKYRLTRASDAHYPEEIGRAWVDLDITKPTFGNIKKALGPAGR